MKTEQRISNYEKMKNEMAGAFLQYDQEKMIRKFGLDYDDDFLYIQFFSRQYRIDRRSGQVSWSADAFRTEEPANYNEAMTIYDVLCYSKDDCHLAHEWANVENLGSVQGGTLEKGGGFYKSAGGYFTGKTAALSHACERLGGEKREKGDTAYELQMFSFLPMVLRFWDADEDFPSSLQLLVDKNILDYMHFETAMFALGHLLQRLREEM